MKTTTSNPKTELLLGEGLHVLHQENRKWQETIVFWIDEVKFFADLLNKKEIASEYGQILINLDKVHEHLFNYLAVDIRNHEQQLSRLYTGEKGLADWDYREKHRSLGEQMDMLTNDFREFKKMVFGYAKKL